MASASFRDSMQSMGWSRRDPDLPVRTDSTTPILSKIQSFNPFASDSVRLPTDEGPGAPLPARSRREEEEAWFALSRWDRLLLFGGLLAASVLLFVLCFVLWPILMVNPRKFGILWSLASVLFLAAWAVMMGPIAYVQHLASGSRLPFTASYFGSIVLTLYFAIGKQSTLLTLITAILQMICLLWYIVSYFPMGSTGLRFAGNFATSRATAWMGS